jgi:hypothetical protein
VECGRLRRRHLAQMSISDYDNTRKHRRQARNHGTVPQAPLLFDFSRTSLDVASA